MVKVDFLLFIVSCSRKHIFCFTHNVIVLRLIFASIKIKTKTKIKTKIKTKTNKIINVGAFNVQIKKFTITKTEDNFYNFYFYSISSTFFGPFLCVSNILGKTSFEFCLHFLCLQLS
jgi:hypothetical protein